MIITKHSEIRAIQRGVSKKVLNLALVLEPKYYCTEYANENNKKRVFYDINLEFALKDEKISIHDYRLLKNLCLIVNHNEKRLITIYKQKLIWIYKWI